MIERTYVLTTIFMKRCYTNREPYHATFKNTSDTMSQSQITLFGIHPITELLRAKRRKLYQLFTTQPTPKGFSGFCSLIPSHIPISYVSREELTRRAGTPDHQGFVALAEPLPIRTRVFDPAKQGFILMLDGIQDPRNLGAIIRSACCTGVQGIVIPRAQSAPLSGIVSKASAGLIDHIDIYQSATSSSAIQEIRSAGYTIYLAALGGIDMRTLHYSEPLCLVIGSEGTGISKAVLNQGTAIAIPHTTPVRAEKHSISYNASVAAGILVFALANSLKKI
jgi:23S rRNA (guanosine2251-2'-O)-methyltransferase